MERYFTTITLLGLNDGNLPVHRGTRQKRYDSIEKMLDLTDVIKRIGPRFPLPAMFLDPNDPEWDDDMTYLYVEYSTMKDTALATSIYSFVFLYNFNQFFHNKNMKFATQSGLFLLTMFMSMTYFKYRK